MKSPLLKEKLKKREVTIGSWITISDPSVAEIMAQAGFDWLTIDIEHSAISIAQAQDLIRIIELAGVAPLVRVTCNDANIIKRVMDAGSHGVIVPMVNSAAEAEAAVAAIKYPPVGKRGVGLSRAQRYGLGFKDYYKWNQEHSVVIVQIEHIDAVNNFEEIMAVEGVDGFLIGPYDLSASMGKPGQFDDPDVVAAIDSVITKAKELDILSGFHVIPPDEESFREKLEAGFKFVAHSLDTLWLAQGCHSTVAADRENIRKN